MVHGNIDLLQSSYWIVGWWWNSISLKRIFKLFLFFELISWDNLGPPTCCNVTWKRQDGGSSGQPGCRQDGQSSIRGWIRADRDRYQGRAISPMHLITQKHTCTRNTAPKHSTSTKDFRAINPVAAADCHPSLKRKAAFQSSNLNQNP